MERIRPLELLDEAETGGFNTHPVHFGCLP
jgi:hypothetical protein